MLDLTRLNGEGILVNPFLIEIVEQKPDTVVTFHSGKTILVKETPEFIQQNFAKFLHDSFHLGAYLQKPRKPNEAG